MGRFLDKLLRNGVCLYCGKKVTGDDGILGGAGGSWCSPEHYDLDQASRF